MENNIIFLIILAFFFLILIITLIIVFVTQNYKSLQGCNSDKDCPSGSICKKNDSSISVCEKKSTTVELMKPAISSKSPKPAEPAISSKSSKPAQKSAEPAEPLKSSKQAQKPVKPAERSKLAQKPAANIEESYVGLNMNKLRKISSDDLSISSKKNTYFNGENLEPEEVDIYDNYTCNKEDEYYLCIGIIDVCSFSNFTLFLLENGNIISENSVKLENTKKEIKNNVILMRIFPFNGYLHAIDRNGYLYSLPNNYLKLNEWTWQKCIWFKDRIKYASTTLDTKYLLLQTYNKSFVFDKAHDKFIKEFDLKDIRRAYGKDLEHYIDINISEQNCIIYPQEKTIENIYDAALNYHNEVVVINSENYDGFLRITIVDWIPYFIRR